MKIFRFLLRFIGVLFAIVTLVAAFSIRRLDDSPYQQNAFYRTMMARLDSLPNGLIDSNTPFPTDTGEMCVGWSKVNITPNYPVPTAGYGKRKGQEIGVVHDSLFVRAFVFEQKGVKSAVVSCDLLIIPPEVTLQLQRELSSINWSWQHVFIGATHTHNSMGAWGKRYIGELFAGKYDQRIVDLLSRSIVEAIRKAEQNIEPATIGFDRIDANEFVRNRLVDSIGTEDPQRSLLLRHIARL
jgi:neutral ceramidase